MYVCTYYTERKERGGEGGRGKKGIYICKIYRVDPFLSAGVVSMRQLALLYMLVYGLHLLVRARTHIYTSVFSHEGTYTYARAHPRENVHTHAHDAYEHKVHAMMHTHAAHARMHPHNAHTCVRTRTREHACICARTRVNTRPHILAAR